MANSINLTLKVNDDGSLDITAKKAKKAAQETEKLGRATNKAAEARNRYNKGEKGVAQAGMNSTKAFSKMRNEMGGGSSGLVGAYATLAANVFAATAAFGALQRAAEFDQLTQSVEFFGNAAGRNLELIVDQLVEVTDGALSAEQAFRGTALAISSGFDTEQLVKLTGVAKGASVALGRDLNDAFDRLVRGAAKLEPEILDELGIMVRLDDAVRDYATEVGKVPGQLTSFEKRQAFLNATIKAGEEQFAELQDSVPVNPFNQLSAAFSNLTKEGIGLLNTVLIPVANFFSSSQTALIGGTVLFASTISRQMLPALADAGGRLRDVAQASRDNSLANLSMLEAVSKNDTRFNRFLKGLADGTKTIDDADEAIDSLNKSHVNHQSILKGTHERVKLNDKSRKAANAGKAATVTQLNLVTAALNANSLATAQNTASSAASAFGALQFGTGFKLLKSAITGYSEELTENDKKSDKTKTKFKGLRVASFGLGAGIRGLTSAVFGLLAPLGLLISFGPAILDFFKNKFFPEDQMQKKFDALLRLTEKVEDAEKQFTETSLTGANMRVAGAKAGLGVQSEIIRMLDQTLALEQKQGTEMAQNAGPRIGFLQADLALLKAQEEQLKANGAANKVNGTAGRKALRDIRAEITATETEITNLQDRLDEGLIKAAGQGEGFKEAITNALAAIKASPEIGTFMSPAIKNLETMLKGFKGTPEEVKALKEAFTLLSNEADAGTQFINGIQGAVAGLATQQNALKSKAQGPYDAITNAAKGVIAEFDKLEESGKSIAEVLQADTLEKYKEQIDNIFGKGATEADMRAFTKKLIENNNTVKEFPGKLEESKQKLQVLNKVAGLSPAAFEAANKELDNQRQLRKDALAAERNLIVAAETKNGILSEEGEILKANFNRRIAAVDAEAKLDTLAVRRIKLSQQTLEDSRERLKIEQDVAKEVSRAIDLTEKSLVQQAKLDNLKKGRGAVTTAVDDFNIQQQLIGERKAAAQEEFELKNRAIEIETRLAKLQFELVQAQLIAAGKFDYIVGAQIGQALKDLDALGDAKKKNNKLDRDNILEGIDLQDKAAKRRALEFLSGKGAGGVAGLLDLQSMTVGEGPMKESGLDFLLNEGELRDKVEFAKGLTAEFKESLKSLGPDGEFVGAVLEGAFAISDAFVVMGEQLKKATTDNEKSAAKFAMVGAAIGAVNSIMQAGYQRNVANIDAQIAAEKKRDGQSAASLAKIQAMEKKKEQQQRKAFEMNKKMLIAQTIMNTAAAVMATLKDTGFFGSPLAMIVAALGAAQVAMIASQSFQGGGSSAGSPNIPTKVTAGKRENVVDLATSRSSRGEIGFMRGEQGMGGIGKFNPTGAFAGYRNRAEGGNTGFMVGEQGPELFVPDRPGRIVPNDDIAAAGGTANVTFNINAVDAAGVEDVLLQQRGNLIGMIREASNSYGQTFLEDVDTSVYSPQGAGVSRY